MRLGNFYIGAPVERVEDLRFLRGRGEYIDDIRREGQWHAAIFRSSVAHAKIRSIDASAALAMPDVHAVLNGMVRVPRPDQHRAAPYQQPVIADGVVRYVGEPVAVILADHSELAEDALEGIVFETEALPVVIEHRPGDERARLFSGYRFQLRGTVYGHAWKHRGSIPAGRICLSPALLGAKTDGAADGDARSTRGMGSRNRPIALGQPDSLVYFGSG